GIVDRVMGRCTDEVSLEFEQAEREAASDVVEFGIRESFNLGGLIADHGRHPLVCLRRHRVAPWTRVYEETPGAAVSNITQHHTTVFTCGASITLRLSTAPRGARDHRQHLVCGTVGAFFFPAYRAERALQHAADADGVGAHVEGDGLLVQRAL